MERNATWPEQTVAMPKYQATLYQQATTDSHMPTAIRKTKPVFIFKLGAFFN
ncbi:hypothetical protein [Oceanisphaera pacifica]|uniref:Uncharacterized protein n=1 Tax=Oceanisphaera pacifica TaxID=2818389 RepID=A0ABS3NBX3_9GAMM|nr:hypothetical protein [Oceanisphaera pacifica]MBO1518091.1 hypothetical protein [Oceanisphaera pacifica]